VSDIGLDFTALYLGAAIALVVPLLVLLLVLLWGTLTRRFGFRARQIIAAVAGPALAALAGQATDQVMRDDEITRIAFYLSLPVQALASLAFLIFGRKA
jgi:MFS family permease